MRWRDRLIGVVLGLILGLGVVSAFVFLYSEQTVDAPSLSSGTRVGRAPAKPGAGAALHRATKGGPPPATVRITGGAPPSSGPAELRYRPGDLVRLRVVSDATVGLELLGYGITRTVPAGEPTRIEFKAAKRGTFPLIVAASHIDVARISVGAPAPP